MMDIQLDVHTGTPLSAVKFHRIIITETDEMMLYWQALAGILYCKRACGSEDTML